MRTVPAQQDALLEAGPYHTSGKVSVGSKWHVSAEKFLRAASQPVPEGVQGKARFVVTSLKDGVARIEFVFEQSYRHQDHDWVGQIQGTWLFDVRRGRDLSLEMKGRVEADKGEFGMGGFKKTRRVTYSDDPKARRS